MWFKTFLAMLGLVWEIIECTACHIKVAIKKGTIAPPGWVRDAADWACPKCSGAECEL
jgi:hypothetical protein